MYQQQSQESFYPQNLDPLNQQYKKSDQKIFQGVNQQSVYTFQSQEDLNLPQQSENILFVKLSDLRIKQWSSMIGVCLEQLFKDDFLKIMSVDPSSKEFCLQRVEEILKECIQNENELTIQSQLMQIGLLEQNESALKEQLEGIKSFYSNQQKRVQQINRSVSNQDLSQTHFQDSEKREQRVKDLQDALENEQKISKELGIELGKYKRECRILQKRIEEQEQEVQEKRELKENNLQQENQNLRIYLQKVQYGLVGEEEKVKQLKRDLGEEKVENLRLVNEIKEKEKKVTELLEQVEDLESEQRQLKQNLEEKNRNLEINNEEFQKFRRQLVECESQKEEIQRKLSEQIKSEEKQQSESEILRKILEKIKEENTSLKEEKKTLQRENKENRNLAENKSYLEKKIQEIQEQKEKLENKNKESQNQAEKFLSDIKNLQEELIELKRKQKILENKENEAEIVCQGLRQEIEEYQKEIQRIRKQDQEYMEMEIKKERKKREEAEKRALESENEKIGFWKKSKENIRKIFASLGEITFALRWEKDRIKNDFQQMLKSYSVDYENFQKKIVQQISFIWEFNYQSRNRNLSEIQILREKIEFFEIQNQENQKKNQELENQNCKLKQKYKNQIFTMQNKLENLDKFKANFLIQIEEKINEINSNNQKSLFEQEKIYSKQISQQINQFLESKNELEKQILFLEENNQIFQNEIARVQKENIKMSLILKEQIKVGEEKAFEKIQQQIYQFQNEIL